MGKKFFIFLFTVAVNFRLVHAFDDEQCLRAPFETKVTTESLLGFSIKDIELRKNDCTINIEVVKWKFFKTQYLVDICRGPVHMRMGQGGGDVYRKSHECRSKSEKNKSAKFLPVGPFCAKAQNLFQVFESDLLVFASGKKELLDSQHGKVYCSYLLLRAHLDEGIVFDRDKDYSGKILVNPY